MSARLPLLVVRILLVVLTVVVRCAYGSFFLSLPAAADAVEEGLFLSKPLAYYKSLLLGRMNTRLKVW